MAGTFLGDLEPAARRALFDDASIRTSAPGELIIPEDQDGIRTAILLDGIARSTLEAPGGRTLTVRFARPGAMIGSTRGLSIDRVPIVATAVTPCAAVVVEAAWLMHQVRSDPGTGVAYTAELTRRLEEVYRTLAGLAFGSLSERIAGHLLEVAETDPDGGLLARLTQQELADGLGTARESVSRALQQARVAGIIRTERGGIRILDPDRLADQTGPWWTSVRTMSVAPVGGPMSVFDSSPHAVVGIDVAGDIIYANDRVERTFGFHPRSLIGRSVRSLMPETAAAGFAEALPGFMTGRIGGPIGLGQAFHGRRADGALFPAEIHLTHVRHAAGLAVFATVIDVGFRLALRQLVIDAVSEVAPSLV